MKFVRHGSARFVLFFLLIFANLALSEPQVVFSTINGNYEISINQSTHNSFA